MIQLSYMPVSFPLSSPTGIVLFLVCPFAWGGLGFFISTCCSVLMPFIYSVQQTALLNSPMLNIFYSTITLGLFLKLFLFLCAGYHTIALTQCTMFLNEMNSIIISLSLFLLILLLPFFFFLPVPLFSSPPHAPNSWSIILLICI